MTQAAILQELIHGPMRPLSIARLTGKSRAHVDKTGRELVALGLCRWDGQVKVGTTLSNTEAGTALIREIETKLTQ